LRAVARFFLSLPRVVGDNSKPPKMAHPMTSPALPRVLVADDEPSTTVIITGVLKGEFEVVPMTTGGAVVERVSAGDIDLVLLDVLMPGLDGFEICRRLKSHPQTSGVPVIFITALDERADEMQGFSVGAVDYIAKPIHPSILRARVRTHVDLKRTRDLLEQLASVDPLTGVANRRQFDRALGEEWRRCRREERWMSLAIADVDHFKQFNDRWGHLAGDERLRAIAASLANCSRRAGDLVARYGGEEFGLILPDVDPSMMHGVTRLLLRSVAGTNGDRCPDGDRIVVTLSVGAISVVPSRDSTATAALAAADALLYEAKSGGRDCCVHLDWSTQQKTVIGRLP
jgi:diguanylate cyclase (GGDEF)-like protein